MGTGWGSAMEWSPSRGLAWALELSPSRGLAWVKEWSGSRGRGLVPGTGPPRVRASGRGPARAWAPAQGTATGTARAGPGCRRRYLQTRGSSARAPAPCARLWRIHACIAVHASKLQQQEDEVGCRGAASVHIARRSVVSAGEQAERAPNCAGFGVGTDVFGEGLAAGLVFLVGLVFFVGLPPLCTGAAGLGLPPLWIGAAGFGLPPLRAGTHAQRQARERAHLPTAWSPSRSGKPAYQELAKRHVQAPLGDPKTWCKTALDRLLRRLLLRRLRRNALGGGLRLGGGRPALRRLRSDTLGGGLGSRPMPEQCRAIVVSDRAVRHESEPCLQRLATRYCGTAAPAIIDAMHGADIRR